MSIIDPSPNGVPPAMTAAAQAALSRSCPLAPVPALISKTDPMDSRPAQPFAFSSNGQSRSRRWALGLLLLSLSAQLLAQEDFKNLYFAVGTVADPPHQDWAYLLVEASSPALLQGRSLAIYAKPGTASSPSPYVRQSVIHLQTHPAALAILLQRSQNLGQNIAALDQQLGDLFGNLMPSTTLKPEEKLSLLLAGAAQDPELFEKLLLLSRVHPAVRLALGLAHAQPMGTAQTTFEIRLFDLNAQQDLTVVGRVTLATGAPTSLPAPEPPVRVPETNPKGHLNVKLRWATQAPLRRLSLLTYGYNLYRLNKSFAEENGFHTAPPSTATLLQLVANHHPAAHRINHVPILANATFDPANVANFIADPATFFAVDDNDRGRPDSTLPPNVFTNGARFYYFATARDILGRDGAVSLPSPEIVVCDRLPPPAPDAVHVENDYVFVPGPPGSAGSADQRLKVYWRQNDPALDSIAGYYVYRWNTPADVQKPTAQQNPISPLILPAPGQSELSFVDNGAGAPAMPQAAGQTFWYTVRAVDAGACDGGNSSAHSAPAFGVLRDREGPPAPVGRLDVRCRQPEVAYTTSIPLAWPSPDPTLAAFQLACVRDHPGATDVAWAEFYSALSTDENPAPPPTNFIGRVTFPKAVLPGEFVNLPFYIHRSLLLGETNLHLFCRIGTYSGQISDYASLIAPPTETTSQFLAVLFTGTVPVVSGVANCPGHTVPEDDLDVCLTLTGPASEYRFYRKIDDGPLTLLGQGSISNQTQICTTDSERSATSGTGCYYAQLLDENGNPSPLALLGCISFTGKGQLPTPILPPPLAIQTPLDPDVMNVLWSAPPHGVARFEVHVAIDNGTTPVQLSDALTPHPNHPNPVQEPVLLAGQTEQKLFRIFLTPQVSPLFGDGSLFSLDVDAQKNTPYVVMVRAVDKAGNTGPFSVGQSFIWSAPVTPFDQVPWPARPLPPVTSFHPSLHAQVMPATVYRGLGIRIGQVYVDPALELNPGELPTHTDPIAYLYKGPLDAPLFPVALYRYQVPSPLFPAPTLSGDVVQVSPLMEQIAYEELPDFNGDGQVAIRIHDPFIAVVLGGVQAVALPPIAGLFLLDTQPVVRGAAYRYLLVRFDPKTKEMVQVIPTNEVLVP